VGRRGKTLTENGAEQADKKKDNYTDGGECDEGKKRTHLSGNKNGIKVALN